MQLPQPPCRLCADIAEAVVGAQSLRSAYDSILTALIPQLSQGRFLAKRARKWVRVAGQLPRDADRWLSQLDIVARQPRKLTVLTGHDHGTITVLPVVTGEGEPTVLVFDGDWSGSQDVLVPVAVVTGFALRSFRHARPDPRPAGLLRHTRRLVRSLRTAHGLEASMRLLADHAAVMLNADRVSVWLFNNEDHALRIAAASGAETAAALRNVRIAPGDRVIGHVYQTGRALFVKDVRALPLHKARYRYRTNAFACVPLREHGITRGVLSITDKRDGSSFDKFDRIALRTLGSFGGTVLAAASSSAEIARLAEAASVDSVTGLLNRSSLDSRLRQEVARANREHGKLAVLIADLDDFKNVNDNYGHQSGDALLSRVGSIIRSSVRSFDICARYGGDEFVVVMPNADEASAVACAERIIATMPKAEDGDGNAISMSIGLTTSVAPAPSRSARR